ncbi:MAG: tetratricopeptide repeat protein [Bacteroidetes bacterium]|nr:MAG: tetratricopeptide repeat protein [Bacteroidota bacterium]
MHYFRIRMKHLSFLLLFLCFSSLVQAQSEPQMALQAETYMRTGQFDQAIGLYKLLIQKNPTNYTYHLNLGWSELNHSGFTAGDAELKKALDLNSGCARCYIGLSIFELQRKKGEAALELAEKAIALDDTASFSYFIRGQVYETVGSNILAEADYNKAISLNKTVADYFYTRGSFFFRLNQFSKALSDFNDAIKLEGSLPDFYFQRGYTHYMLKDLSGAEKDISKALSIDSTSADYWLGLGAVYDEQLQLDKALAAYDKASYYNPKNTMAFYNKANIHYSRGELDRSCVEFVNAYLVLRKSGQTKGGIYDEVEGMVSNHCDTSIASFYYQRALLYQEVGELDIALRLLDLGLAKWPNHPILNTIKGNVYLQAHEFSKAEASYRLTLANTDEIPTDIRGSYILKLNEGDPSTYMRQHYMRTYEGLSKALLAQNKMDDARAQIQKAIFLGDHLEGQNTELLQVQEAHILAGAEAYDEAIALLEKLIIKNPQLAEAYVVRARISLIKAIKSKNRKARITHQAAPESGLYYFKAERIKLGKLDNLLYQSALQDCRTALAMNQNLSEAWFILAQAEYYSNKDFCTELLKARSAGILDALSIIENSCIEQIKDSQE